MFLATEFLLTTTIVMEEVYVLFVGFVILLIKLSERLTRISLFLSAVVSFLVVGLVLQRGCVYLLLDVDTVRCFVLYRFCPPCSAHCASI